MSDENKQQKLVSEEVELLTICYERPGKIEDLASEMEKESPEIEAILESLSKKGLVKEAEGIWSSTTDGDLYIEEDKNPKTE